MPSDGTTDMLFIKTPTFRHLRGFVSDIKAVNRLRIEAEFFQEGRRVFEFDVAGLQWP